MVDAAGYYRLVRIPFQELDNHFLPDPRDEHGAPSCARQNLADAYKAGTVFISLLISIPVKFHLHPAISIRINLLAGRTNNDSCLHALDPRLTRYPLRPKLHSKGDAGKLIFVDLFRLRVSCGV